MRSFMEQHVFPAEAVYDRQLAEADDPHALPPVMAELKEKARAEGLWNLFMAHGDWGAGLSNLEYAPLAELAGRSIIGPEVFNCSAPDTGNMELLALYGTPEQQERWLRPLLDAEIRSCFAMTEPEVASSDARNIRTLISRDGDSYVVNGRKWYTSGILDPDCKLIILMGKTDPDAPTYRQQSMLLIPRDTPGVTVLRDLPMFGYTDRLGHGDVLFEDVRVPVENILRGEGEGFALAQGRLGPGRMHYAMRAVGFAERALRLMCERVTDRIAFGGPLAGRGARVDRPQPHRDRTAAPPRPQVRLADGHRRQRRRPYGGRRDQGRGAGGRPQGGRPRGAGARRGGGQRRHRTGPAVRHHAGTAHRRRPRRGASADGGPPGARQVPEEGRARDGRASED
jgi:acyl-CoA dehydrogenase